MFHIDWVPLRFQNQPVVNTNNVGGNVAYLNCFFQSINPNLSASDFKIDCVYKTSVQTSVEICI